MSKTLAIFFAIVALVLGLFLLVFAVRFEAARTENIFLLKLARLENATIEEYQAQFGKPMYSFEPGKDLWEPIAGKLTAGQTGHFFSAQTVPTKFLVVVSNADGSVAWRTWTEM